MSSRFPFSSLCVIALSMIVFAGCRPQPAETPVAIQAPSPTPAESQPEPDTESPDPLNSAEVASADGEPKEPPAETKPESDPDSGPLTAAELEEEYVPDPEILAELEAQRQALRRLADTYDPPPQAKQLGKEADLWVDVKSKRVYIDGYVSMKRGPLEMLACPVGTKEHESVIALFAKSSDVHAALLAVGAKSGTTATWDPEFAPPTGQTVLVWIAYREPLSIPKIEGEPKPQVFVPDEKFKVVDARQWIRRIETQEELTEPWVFSGSSFWTDPEEGTEYYSANAGDMICVSNFSTAMMDVPFASSADAGNILFEPYGERIPMRGTPVRLILAPQPINNESPDGNSPEPAESSKLTKQPEPGEPPTESVLPMPE